MKKRGRVQRERQDDTRRINSGRTWSWRIVVVTLSEAFLRPTIEGSKWGLGFLMIVSSMKEVPDKNSGSPFRMKYRDSTTNQVWKVVMESNVQN